MDIQLSAVLGLFNSDLMVPAVKSWFHGSILATMIALSIFANARVVAAYWLCGKGIKLFGCKSPSGWAVRAIERYGMWSILAIAPLPLIPGFRSTCAAICGVTQWQRGLVALLAANVLHVIITVLCWERASYLLGQ